MLRVVSSLLLLALLAITASAQAPIPYRVDGFSSPAGGVAGAPIEFDFFLDLLCPDCHDAWPNIQSVVTYYGKNINARLHTFPLPYHTWGFLAAQSFHVVNSANSTVAAFQWADTLFANQQNFWNGVTSQNTGADVLAQLQKLAVSSGVITAQAFAAGMNDDNLNEETRVSWKYACSRGVLGTPTFFVNGVQVNGQPSWALSDWRMIMDPLLQPQPTKQVKQQAHKHHHKQHNKQQTTTVAFAPPTCPSGYPLCQYLPGQFNCCKPGEMCIPNVGCRC